LVAQNSKGPKLKYTGNSKITCKTINNSCYVSKFSKNENGEETKVN
jgi:hypothetical protein